MAIESIDKIVRTEVQDMPTLARLMGRCGMIITCEISPAGNGYYCMKNLDTGKMDMVRGSRKFDLLVPAGIGGEAEVYLALWTMGMVE